MTAGGEAGSPGGAAVGKAGTCGACFGVFAVRPDGAVARHGWPEVGGVRRVGEAGNVSHGEPCFGAGRPPYEASVACTEAYLAEVLRPAAERLAYARNDEPLTLARAQLLAVLDATRRCEEAARSWPPAGPPPARAPRGPRVHLRGDDVHAACGKRLRAWANSPPLPTTARPEEVTCPRPGCAPPRAIPTDPKESAP